MKTDAQKLEGATKKIKQQKKQLAQLGREKNAANHLARTYRNKAKADNARLRTSEMFIAYLAGRLSAAGELIIPIPDLYACKDRTVTLEPLEEKNAFRVFVRSADPPEKQN